MNLAIKRIISMNDSYTRTNTPGPVRARKGRRKVRTPLGVFATAEQAAEAHKCYVTQIWNSIHSKTPGFGYVALEARQ